MTTARSDIPIDIVAELCTLPVVCLQTANFSLNVGDVIKNKNIVIDLWTTRCTRCPAALDTLNHFAITSTKLADDDADATTSIQCLSICCGDTLDGAREIIETTKLPRWGAIQHYFMAYNDKERCKQLLTFRQVPFYIVFDCNGTLLYAGNQKLDWQTLFKENSNRIDPGTDLPTVDVKVGTQSDRSVHSPTSATTVPMIPQQLLQEEISTFVIDDMDF